MNIFVNLKHMRYLPVKMSTNFVFQKNNFGNLNKLQSIVNIFVFLYEKESKNQIPVSEQHPLSFNPSLSTKNISSPPLLPN